MADASECDLHGPERYVPDVPITCPIRRQIIAEAQSVGELVNRVAAHKLHCVECGGVVIEERRAA